MSLSWLEFAWSCFHYGSLGGDRDYQRLMANTALVQQVQQAPQSVPDAQFASAIISDFLNRWKCRLPATPATVAAIKACLVQLQPITVAMSTLTIRDPIATPVAVQGLGVITLGEAIAKSYVVLNRCVSRFGATAATKFLHVLQPHLFVMWDKPILACYHLRDRQIDDSGAGYLKFHERMRDIVLAVDHGFTTAAVSPLPGAGMQFEQYLSVHLNYAPAKSAAKFVDEYNWVTITNQVSVPPAWHP